MKNGVWGQLMIAAGLLATGLPVFGGAHTWTGGGGANKYFNNSANWSGGAPTAGEGAPVTLSFPAGTLATNNIAGLAVDTLVLTGNGTVLHGYNGGSLTFRGAGGTNLIQTGGYMNSNTIASTLPVAMQGTNLFLVTNSTVLNIQSVISGTGDLEIIGMSTVMFTGPQANTRSGETFVNRGILKLGKTPGVAAVAGRLTISNTNNDSWAQLSVLADNEIPDTVPVALNIHGNFFLHGNSETVGPLTLRGGYIETEAGVLTLATNVTVLDAGFATSMMGSISLGGGARIFDMQGANASISAMATISNGGIVQNGNGSLNLNGTNTYSGGTVVNGGNIRVYNPFSLGNGSSITIASNASLTLWDRVSVTNKTLNLAGTVYPYNTNTWAGPIVLSGQGIMFCGNNTLMTIHGAVSGSGQLVKSSPGTLILSGGTANTYSGGTLINEGSLKLSKTNAVAVPGPLAAAVGWYNTVQLLQNEQIGDSAAVTLGPLSTLDLNSKTETIGSLAGGGIVSLVTGTLAVGGNNLDSTFSGIIAGVGFAPLIKSGSGTLTLNGTNTCSGTTTVNAGKLVVNGTLPGLLNLNMLASLGGTGTVGHVTASLAKVAPGNSVGRITTGNLNVNNAGSSLEFQIGGPDPGTGYDQIVANGTVSLSNPTLNVSMTTAGAIGKEYVLIANDGSDAITGTFNGLPEGSTLSAGPAAFKISYKGGTGSNDVVLIQTAGPAAQIGGIKNLGNGAMQISGQGLAGLNYAIQANTNLNTTNWITVGNVAADMAGAISFVDSNLTSVPMRFYRFTAQ